VIVIKSKGEIVYCNPQVEKILSHRTDNLIRSNVKELLLPISYESIGKLIVSLTKSNTANYQKKEEDNGASFFSSETSCETALSSEQSFPLSVVKVMGPNKNSSGGNTNNGSCDRGKNASRMSDSLSSNNSSQSGSDEDRAAVKNPLKNINNVGGPNNSDENLIVDSFSVEAKMRARDSLNGNVQQHKYQIRKDKRKRAAKHVDDVTGEPVTSNNADARLSSLQHHTKNGKDSLPLIDGQKEKVKKNAFENLGTEAQSTSSESLSGVDERTSLKRNGSTEQQQSVRPSNEDESDDSGYRQGSESADDSSINNQPKVQRSSTTVPTCNMCFIRDDLTTVWCEVTASNRAVSSYEKTTVSPSPSSPLQQIDALNPHMELLLCLRPIKDGAEMATEEFRLKPKHKISTVDDDVLRKQLSKNEKSHSAVVSIASEKQSNHNSTRRNLSKRAMNTFDASSHNKKPPKKRLIREN